MTTATETSQRITQKQIEVNRINFLFFFFHYSKKHDVVTLESLSEGDRALDPTVK